MKHLNFDLTVFQNLYSLNTGRVNLCCHGNCYTQSDLSGSTLTQLYDVTSQVQLGSAQQMQKLYFKRIPNMTKMNLLTNSPPTYLTTYSINWCPKALTCGINWSPKTCGIDWRL